MAGRHGSALGGLSEEEKEKNRSETAPSSPRLLGIRRSKSFLAVQRWTEPGKLRAPGRVDKEEEGKQRNRAEGRERKRFRGVSPFLHVGAERNEGKVATRQSPGTIWRSIPAKWRGAGGKKNKQKKRERRKKKPEKRRKPKKKRKIRKKQQPGG